MNDAAAPYGHRFLSQANWPIFVLIALCVVIEATLQLADRGILGIPRLRTMVYYGGAFFSGVLHGWRPNFDAQPVTMFVTHAFIHTGLTHLTFNMITLAVLGRDVIEDFGSQGFLLIYAGSALGGAIGFALLGPVLVPMVGASGAIFGLAGAIVVCGAQDRLKAQDSLTPVYRAIIILLILNLLPWWILQGNLAWQSHLGGFLAGGGLAAVMARRD